MSMKELIELNKTVTKKNYQRRIKNIILTNYYNNDESIRNLITIATTEFNYKLKDELFNYYESELNKEKHFYQRHGYEANMLTENYNNKMEISEEEIEISLQIFKDIEIQKRELEEVNKLNLSIKQLSDEERKFIEILYFDCLSTRDAAKKLCLHKTQIVRKRNKILKKLQKSIEN